MRNGSKLSVAAAALGGLLIGTAARAATLSSPVQLPAARSISKSVEAGHKAVKPDESAKGDKHDCKGKNDCKGKGGCKSGDNGCKGKNSCKGKGGCKSGGHESGGSKL